MQRNNKLYDNILLSLYLHQNSENCMFFIASDTVFKSQNLRLRTLSTGIEIIN